MYEDDEKLKNDDLFTFELAGLGPRLVASIIDGIIMSIISGIIIGAATHSGGSFALSTLLNFLYLWYFWTQRDGQTPGKIAMKIKVIKTDGSPMNNTDVLLRLLS
jgi:uncharacterized RDD family membrane protein YckC